MEHSGPRPAVTAFSQPDLTGQTPRIRAIAPTSSATRGDLTFEPRHLGCFLATQGGRLAGFSRAAPTGGCGSKLGCQQAALKIL
ncbi:hypothetical protein BH10PLA2_BH10PLA2_37850 [soil metagenome]